MKRTGKTSPQYDVAWNTAVTMNEFRLIDLIDKTGMAESTIRRWVMQWRMSGAVVERGTDQLGKIFSVADRSSASMARLGARSDKVETAEGNMWRAMRMMREFSARDIAAHACTQTVPVHEGDALRYCDMLARAEYLRETRRALSSGRPALFRLIRDTGPRPPRARRVTGVYDANVDTFIQLGGGRT